MSDLQQLIEAARRCPRTDEAGALLDWLAELCDDPRSRFMRLHERPTGTTATLYPLREDLVIYIDSPAQRGRAQQADIVLEARHALCCERPEWSAVVEACCFGRPNVKQQAMAERLGVSQPVVSKRMRQGLRWLREWCLAEMATAKGA